jgi:hypothetical protein
VQAPHRTHVHTPITSTPTSQPDCIYSLQANSKNRTLDINFYSESTVLIEFPDVHRKMAALVDTGAAVSCCSTSLLDKIRPSYKHQLLPTTRNFTAANGQAFNPVGTIRLHFLLNKTAYEETFYVFKQLNHSIILGKSFLQYNNATLNFHKDKFAVAPTLNVHAVHRSPIPANTSMIISGKISDRNQRFDVSTGLIGVVSPSPTQTRYPVEHCAATVYNNQVPVIVHNTSDKTIYIGSGQHIATFEPLLSDDVSAVRDITSPAKRSQTHQDSAYDDFDLSNADCTDVEKEQLLLILQKHKHAFMDKQKNLGFCDIVKHRILMKPDAEYKDTQPFRFPPDVREQINLQIKYLLDQGVIERDKEILFASPLLAVKKHCKKSQKHVHKPSTPEYRMVLDLRSLNGQSLYYKFCMPNFSSFLDTLAEKKPKFFSSLDLASGFSQLALEDESKKLCGFHWEGHSYNYSRMAQGLAGAPSTFSRALSIILKDYLNDSVLLYIDDILIISPDFETHKRDIENVLMALHNANLKISQSKCSFAKTEIKYLGHIISQTGITPAEDHTAALATFPTPTDKKSLKSLLGIITYFQSFIPNRAKLVKPLQKLVTPKAKFEWNTECEEAFKQIKSIMSSKPFLHYPDFTKEFVVMTDASTYSIAAGLFNRDSDGMLLPIAFTGRALQDAETRRAIFELEALSVVHALEKFNHYLMGRHFTLLCDNNSLVEILSKHRSEKRLSSKIDRWILFITSFDFEVKHISTRANFIADALSRRKYDAPSPSDVSYPGLDNFPHSAQIDAITRAMARHECNSDYAMAPRPRQHGQTSLPTSPDANVNTPQRHINVDKSGVTPQSADATNNGCKTDTQSAKRSPPTYDKRAGNNIGSRACNKDASEAQTECHNSHEPPVTTQNSRFVHFDLDLKEIAIEQRKHKPFRDLINYLKDNKLPPTKKRLDYCVLRENSHDLFGEHDLLVTYCHAKSLNHGPKILIPPWYVHKIIRLFHVTLYPHTGIFKTTTCIRQHFAWKGLNQDVVKFISNCETCLLSKASINPEKRMRQIIEPPSKPHSTLQIDHLGPFKLGPCKSRFILTVVCLLSGYVTAIPVRSTGAEETCRALYDNVFTKFGFADNIISDNGPAFISSLYKAMAKLFDIKLTFASCYTPKSTAKVERSHGSLLDTLRCLTSAHPENWPIYLSAAVNCVNNTPNSTTKVSPSMIVFGRDTTALKNIHLDMDEKSIPELIREIQEVQKWAAQQATALKRSADEEAQRKFNSSRNPTKIHEGATVYWRKPSIRDPHENSKLQTNTRKYTAFDIKNNSCQLKDQTTQKIYKYRVSIDQLIFPSKHNDNC